MKKKKEEQQGIDKDGYFVESANRYKSFVEELFRKRWYNYCADGLVILLCIPLSPLLLVTYLIGKAWEKVEEAIK